MSNQFYSYLSKIILDYFETKGLKQGDKFNIEFEKEEQVIQLYEALEKNEKVEPFIYRINDSVEYKSYCIVINGLRIIVAATINDITPDFLIRLRNLVGDESNPKFKNTAILFIHNTTLDSIVRGTESFFKEGMPFHPETIYKGIKEELQKSKLEDQDQHILEFTLKEKRKDLLQDHSSLFEYEDLLKVLNTGKIEREEYKNFGLFYDSNLTQEEGMIQKRLKENAELFQKIEAIHQYGNPDDELEKFLDEDGAKLLKNQQEWFDEDYKLVKISIDNKINEEDIKYEQIFVEGHIKYWDRPLGETTVKRRKRNIIIFNEENVEEINLEIVFNGHVKSVSLNQIKNKPIILSTSGKRIKATIHPQLEKASFFNIVYEDGVKYEFRVVVLSCNEKVFQNIKTFYTIHVRNKDELVLCNTDEEKICINQGKLNIRKEEVSKYNDEIIIGTDEEVQISFNGAEYEDEEYIKCNLIINNQIIPIAKQEEKERPTVITGVKVWKLKRENKEHLI